MFENYKFSGILFVFLLVTRVYLRRINCIRMYLTHFSIFIKQKNTDGFLKLVLFLRCLIRKNSKQHAILKTIIRIFVFLSVVISTE
jgi:hypothetical protein